AEQLKAAVQDEDANVRHFVGQLLVSMGIVELDNAPLADVASTACPVKRRKLAVSLFEAILCDADRDLRQAAAEALGRLGDPRAQSALVRVQSDIDPSVRAAAEAALSALAQPMVQV